MNRSALPRHLYSECTIAVGWLLIVCPTVVVTSAAEPNRPLVVGHRGLMHAAPECTLAGFRACLALRVGFEFDVRRTKDGALLCLHDATLAGTTAASMASGCLGSRKFSRSSTKRRRRMRFSPWI